MLVWPENHRIVASTKSSCEDAFCLVFGHSAIIARESLLWWCMYIYTHKQSSLNPAVPCSTPTGRNLVEESWLKE